eukprot:GILK01002967.1.p1 GENE.GILK01002967.1~~GILK01002967.1.p1  ORF type:complete len:528 (+),score=103.98 GILK01002967.1:125-1708(+)
MEVGADDSAGAPLSAKGVNPWIPPPELEEWAEQKVGRILDFLPKSAISMTLAKVADESEGQEGLSLDLLLLAHGTHMLVSAIDEVKRSTFDALTHSAPGNAKVLELAKLCPREFRRDEVLKICHNDKILGLDYLLYGKETLDIKVIPMLKTLIFKKIVAQRVTEVMSDLFLPTVQPFPQPSSPSSVSQSRRNSNASTGQRTLRPLSRAKKSYKTKNATLQEILADGGSARQFRDFLVDDWNLHNLQFWLDVEEYRHLPTALWFKRMCRKVYDKFLKPDAKLRIRLPSEMLEKLDSDLNSPVLYPDIYAPAQEYAFQCMSKKYEDFKSSMFYKRMKQSIDMIRKAENPKKSFSLFSCFGRKRTNRYIEAITPRSMEMPTNLDELLPESTLHVFYKEFLEASHSEKLLFFWSDLEDLKRMPNQTYINNVARKLFKKYLHPNSKIKVNIPNSTIVAIEKRLDRGDTNHLFDEAQKIVTSQINNDALPRFKQFLDEKRREKESMERELVAARRRSSAFFGRPRYNDAPKTM